MKGCAELFEIEEDDLATFKKILGEEFILRFGVVGKKHFLCTFGGGAKRYEAACKIAASGGDSLANDKGIAELARVLPKQRSIEGYIAVDNILQIAKSVAKIVGEEEGMPFEVPKIDAPIVFGAAQVGDMQCFKLFVPMKLVTAIKKIIDEQAKAEMEAFDEEDEDEDDDDDDDDD
ncbi:MAG: hypothetical protein ACE5EC_05615 [Phycisphaerae bacterium]